eukprot:m.298581 g.298581  ORF g.298581 m.298581 type:complete len:293 (-) comp13900_c0_seq1:301-1179(-)
MGPGHPCCGGSGGGCALGGTPPPYARHSLSRGSTCVQCACCWGCRVLLLMRDCWPVLQGAAPAMATTAAPVSAQPSLLGDITNGVVRLAPTEAQTKGSLATPQQLLMFFESHCTPPQLGVCVYGWHEEEEEGRVEDFRINFDLSPYIVPYGYMHPADKSVTLEQCLDSYIRSESPVKTLTMKKHVDWPYEAMRAKIEERIKGLGYKHNIEIKFSSSNCRVVAKADTSLSRMTENSGMARFFCAPCVWTLDRQDKKEFAKRTIRATFHMSVTLEQWWEENSGAIRVFAKYSRV